MFSIGASQQRNAKWAVADTRGDDWYQPLSVKVKARGVEIWLYLIGS